MSYFVDATVVEKGKEEVVERLEKAVRETAEENMVLFEEMMRKQALVEQAELLHAELDDLLEQKQNEMNKKAPDSQGSSSIRFSTSPINIPTL